MAVLPPTGFDDETVAWGYAPPSYLEGETPVPIPANKPGLEIAPNQPVRLDSGVVAYRETAGHRQQVMEYERQAAAAREAARQAAEDAAMFQQMSRVATSMKDIEIARRSIDVMGLQRDIQGGMPIHQAVARHPLALGAGFANALRATAPAPTVPRPEEVTLPSGAKGVLTGRYGDQFRYAPTTGQEHPLDTTGAVLKDPESGKRIGLVYRSGPTTQRIVLDEVPGNVDTRTANAIYSSQERALMDELKDIENRAALLNPKNPKYEYLKGLQDQLKTVRAKRAALIEPPAPAATKPLSKEQALEFLKRAGGDKAKARQMARDAGFTF